MHMYFGCSMFHLQFPKTIDECSTCLPLTKATVSFSRIVQLPSWFLENDVAALKTCRQERYVYLAYSKHLLELNSKHCTALFCMAIKTIH